MSGDAVLAALRRLAIGKEEMSGHGFRAMARTLLDEVLGFGPEYIEHHLTRVVRDPLGRAYNRRAHSPQRRKMMRLPGPVSSRVGWIGGACNYRRSVGSARCACPGLRMEYTAWPNGYGPPTSWIVQWVPFQKEGYNEGTTAGRSEISLLYLIVYI